MYINIHIYIYIVIHIKFTYNPIFSNYIVRFIFHLIESIVYLFIISSYRITSTYRAPAKYFSRNLNGSFYTFFVSIYSIEYLELDFFE